MKKLRFLASLVTSNNDYQQAQAAAAREAARRLGVSVQITYAETDAITQSTELLTAIQSASELRPDAILVNPVRGTGLPQVAHAAATAGIAWVVLNRKAEYISDLIRELPNSLMFSVSPDQVEIGRIQGRQFGALLPNGGSVLYIQGPSGNSTVIDRTAGMRETRPANIQVTALKGQWTEPSAEEAVSGCGWRRRAGRSSTWSEARMTSWPWAQEKPSKIKAVHCDNGGSAYPSPELTACLRPGKHGCGWAS